jgi:hypothetical protein
VTPEVDLERIIIKGKAHREGASTVEQSISDNYPSPSLETPFTTSHFPFIPSAEVSRTLNFGSVPVEFPPPILRLEGEILVTPLSPEAIPWPNSRTTEYFPTPSFTTPPLITISATVEREASSNSRLVASPHNPPFFPFPPGSSIPTSPVRNPSPPSSPSPNIPYGRRESPHD